MNAWTTTTLGSPEGELAIARGGPLSRHRAEIECRLHCIEVPPRRAAKETGSLMPPKHILNAPTKLMKKGYGENYHYDHDADGAFSGQDYFPDEMERRTFYDPPNAASSVKSGNGSTIGRRSGASAAAKPFRLMKHRQYCFRLVAGSDRKPAFRACSGYVPATIKSWRGREIGRATVRLPSARYLREEARSNTKGRSTP